jgi:anti-sigma28 factor (negative regulator of flagellin synthesis)
MRVDNQGSQGINDNSRASATRSAGLQASSTGHMSLTKSGSDQVSLSGASSLLSLAKGLPSDRQSKIEALTSQYQSGSYRPDSAAIASSFVQSLLK